MNVEISKAAAPETPASVLTEQMVEHILSIMMLCGIEGISATKYQCGFGTQLNVTIAPFANVPEKVSAQGVIIKDALAQIMSVANVTRLLAKPSDTDLKELRETWKESAKSAEALNGGSGQAFAASGAPDGSGEG